MVYRSRNGTGEQRIVWHDTKTNDRRVNMGVIGCGHWGPNHIRVFSEIERAHVVSCADPSPQCLGRVRQRFPYINRLADYRRLLDDPSIDAVVVATPTHTHADIVAQALDAGKHVLAEKPLCIEAVHGYELAARAKRADRVLMVGQVFLFNNGIIRLHDLMAGDALGSIHYLDAVRTNLGPVRGDVNALYDLGTHDISIFNYLLGATPVGVSATGSRISQDRLEDVCFATLRYPRGTIAHLHVSWLNPRKVRTLTVVGAARMAHWDDIDPCDTLRIYDKGFDEPPSYDSFGQFQYMLRSGDVHLPTIAQCEPLVNQARAFIASVLDGLPVRSGAAEAVAVVEVLEAAQASIENGGQFSPVGHAHADKPLTRCADTVTRRTVSVSDASAISDAHPV